jgi:hypothetical protein
VKLAKKAAKAEGNFFQIFLIFFSRQPGDLSAGGKLKPIVPFTLPPVGQRLPPDENSLTFRGAADRAA